MKSLFFPALLLAGGLMQCIAAEALFFPISLNGIDSASQTTINQLYREDYENFSKQQVRLAPESKTCGTRECALSAGKELGAKEVLFGSGRKLGEKWIVTAYRIRTEDGKVLATARIDSKSLEDFEFAMKRVAEALAKEKTLEEVASVDNVTESEMDENSQRRREGFYALGIKFGYLFPSGNKSYLKYNSTGSYFSPSYTVSQYKQILVTDWVNWFELPKDLALEWDFHVGWGAEVGTHFSLLKLFSRGDFAPYAGGGVGLDYVFADNEDAVAASGGTLDPDKRNSGFALNAKVGMLLLRTYSFRIMVDAGYKVVFNDDVDQGIVANMGIMWKKRAGGAQVESSSSRNPLMGGLAIIGGIVVLVMVVGLAAN